MRAHRSLSLCVSLCVSLCGRFALPLASHTHNGLRTTNAERTEGREGGEVRERGPSLSKTERTKGKRGDLHLSLSLSFSHSLPLNVSVYEWVGGWRVLSVDVYPCMSVLHHFPSVRQALLFSAAPCRYLVLSSLVPSASLLGHAQRCRSRKRSEAPRREWERKWQRERWASNKRSAPPLLDSAEPAAAPAAPSLRLAPSLRVRADTNCRRRRGREASPDNAHEPRFRLYTVAPTSSGG